MWVPTPSPVERLEHATVIEAEYRELLASPRQLVVDRYRDGFRAGDHELILGCLTGDVTWDIVGHATSTGKAEFEALIDGPTGATLPRLVVECEVEGDDVIVVFGAGELEEADGIRHTFRFADSFAFRGDLVAGVVSYVVPT